MATGGRREEIDAKIARWERELEYVRLALAKASDAVNAKHHPAFVDLYRHKEVVKSRWESIRGVYHPDAEAVQRCEEALVAMEEAWAAAHGMLAEFRATSKS
jgi:hypothetical protein